MLDYTDISNLVSKGVPSSTITAYLQSTRKAYNLTYARIAGAEIRGCHGSIA